MDNEKLMLYYKLLEQVLRLISAPGKIDLEMLYVPLGEICRLFRICRGVTRFYRSTEHERAGIGETFICYDNGLEGRKVCGKRIVTSSLSVAECSLYMAENAQPFDEEEREKIELVVDMILAFLTRSRQESQIEKLTFYDDSGYMNTRSFMRFLIRLNEQNALYGYSAVRLNLRHFSLINQEIGRSFGDIVMRKFFDLISDAVGEKGIVCRVGGDNFIAVVENENLDSVLEILKGTPIIYDLSRTKRVLVSADAGVYVIPEGFPFTRPDEIMDRLVAAVMAAKTGGKDSVVFYSDKMSVDKEKRMRIQHSFPLAMQNRDIKVFYQPKIDICTGEMIGAEALCRWFRGNEIVSPMEFIPVLEQTTEICALDFYMLNEVCGDIRRWLDEGCRVVRVSVNLSRKHMMDIDLLERIMSIIRKNDVPPQYIEIELTETTTDVEFRDLKRVVSGLQQQGVYTSVDDFGMGYSSLNLIREIPWNVLKVDRSFLPVEEDGQESNRSIMFKYVVAMAKEMGLECIAEGVETKSQVDVLRANSCEFAQGFFFDRPLPVGEFEKRLRDYHYEVESGENKSTAEV